MVSSDGSTEVPVQPSRPVQFIYWLHSPLLSLLLGCTSRSRVCVLGDGQPVPLA